MHHLADGTVRKKIESDGTIFLRGEMNGEDGNTYFMTVIKSPDGKEFTMVVNQNEDVVYGEKKGMDGEDEE